MAAKGYTSKTALEDYILQDIDGAYATQIDEYIEAAERIIDADTGRNFKADSVASARVFDGDDSDILIIDDAVEIATVEVGQDSYGSSFQSISASGADRYFTEPENAALIGKPITRIALNARRFPAGRQNNRVTAKWGYSVAVPKDIKFVATVFVAGILNASRQGGDAIKSERIGNYTVTYNSDIGSDSWTDFEKAKSILASYRRYNI